MDTFIGALGFGLAVAFIFVGMAGIVLPVLPGMLLVWFTIVVYAWRTGFEVIGWPTLTVISVIALVAGTAQFWLSLLGAQKQGASTRSLVLGVIGAIIGTFVIPIPLLGTVIGYALGVFLGQWVKLRDARLALRASVGGVAGWGVSTIIELGAAVFILIIFVVQVLFF